MNEHDDAGRSREVVSLLDAALVLVRRRKLLLWFLVGGGVLGLVLGLSAPPQYQASMTVISELGGDAASPGGLGATLRNFGFSLPGGAGAGSLSTQAIPEIAGSREVRLRVARDSFLVSESDVRVSLVDHLARPPTFGLGTIFRFVRSWTVGLPSRARRLFQTPRILQSDPRGEGYLTEEEDAAIRFVAGAVSVSENLDSGLITISAMADEPVLASQLVESVATHLRARVQEVFTTKTRENLRFVENQFESAREELEEADRALASFEDRNLDTRSSRLQLEGQRLQREVSFKAQLYTELQAQLTQAQIELQQSEPVITTIEAPSPPLRPSGPNRRLIVLFYLLIGGAAGTTLILVLESVGKASEDKLKQQKLTEIVDSVLPAPLSRRVLNRVSDKS